MKKWGLNVIAMAAVLLPVSADGQTRQGRIDVPVMAGADPDLDACSASGTVMGLNPRGDGFLSVRSGPGGRPYTEIDRVYNGMRVSICDQIGPWMAVVYTTSPNMDCNVSTPWPRRLAYTGPCRYGWVHSRYIGDLAG